MTDIIEATYNLLDTLDSSELLKELTKYKQRLMNNKEMLAMIKDIKSESNSDKLIAKRITLFNNKDYQMYQKYYNELSLIVLKINHKYKEYTSTRVHSCKESL